MTDETRRGRVLDFLREAHSPATTVQLARHAGVKRGERAAFRRMLREMVRRGELQRGRGQTFRLAVARPTFTGKLTVNRRGFGFVAVDGQPGRDIFIPANHLGGAIDGDIVRVREDWAARGRRVGRVVEIVERTRRRFVGTIVRRGRNFYAVDIAGHLPDPAPIRPGDLDGASEGDVAGIEIVDLPGRAPGYAARVLRTFDSSDSLDALVAQVVFERGLREEFPEEVLAEAAAIDETRPPWNAPAPTDLGDIPFVTIDGADARDFDDAVALVPKGNGFDVWVAIADVAHYVRPGSALDREALERGTSVYFPTRVLPMLPERLSNDLCSLRPKVWRRAVVTRIHFDRRLRATSVQFLRARIRSRARLTYDQVQRLFDGERTGLPPRPLHEMLRQLHRLAARLRQRRLRRGGIDLHIPEPHFRLDASGKRLVDVEARGRTEATGLIEELMLLVNCETARVLRTRHIPAIWRVHEPPNPERLQRFLAAAAAVVPELAAVSEPDARKVQAILDGVENPALHGLLQSLLLRAMARARYDVEPLGHYGLGFDAYVHCTSPIRRYPDLVTQRIIASRLIGRAPAARRAGGVPPRGPAVVDLAEVARLSSDAEQRAQEASWDVAAAFKARWAEDHVGEVFDGTVAGVTSSGAFVTLGEHPVEGFLPTHALPPDHYEFDERHLELRGRASGGVVAMGQRVRVAIAAADALTRRIELALAGPLARRTAGRGQAAARSAGRGRARARAGGGASRRRKRKPSR